jgi:hypothetical protein
VERAAPGIAVVAAENAGDETHEEHWRVPLVIAMALAMTFAQRRL